VGPVARSPTRKPLDKSGRDDAQNNRERRGGTLRPVAKPDGWTPDSSPMGRVEDRPRGERKMGDRKFGQHRTDDRRSDNARGDDRKPTGRSFGHAATPRRWTMTVVATPVALPTGPCAGEDKPKAKFGDRTGAPAKRPPTNTSALTAHPAMTPRHDRAPVMTGPPP
jgi:hypothetical protein